MASACEISPKLFCKDAAANTVSCPDPALPPALGDAPPYAGAQPASATHVARDAAAAATARAPRALALRRTPRPVAPVAVVVAVVVSCTVMTAPLPSRSRHS